MLFRHRFSVALVRVENYRRHSAFHSGDSEDLVLENFTKGENVFRSQQADNVVFTSDFVDIADLREFYKAVSDLLQLPRLDEQVENDYDVVQQGDCTSG